MVAQYCCGFWLLFVAARSAKVIVQGLESEPQRILGGVFQGTVLGPPSWNVFFADVAEPVQEAGFKEDVFADDLTCEKEFPTSCLDEDVFGELSECQRDVHFWGVRNRVLFDAGKEAMSIMHPVFGNGDVFKYLGAKFDCKLVMAEEVARVIGKCKPQIAVILRCRGFYPMCD